MSFDLTNKPIETTFHNLLQRTGSGRLYDLKGLEITDLRINGTLFADQYVVSSSVTEVKFQRRSGSTISGDTQDDIHQFTGSLDITGSITSSGNISSSGYVYGDRIYVNEKILGDYTSDTLRVGFDDGVTALSYGKQSIPHYFEGNITASGNISSSGTITAEQLTTSDDLTVGDDIIMSDGGRIKDVAGNDDYIIFDQ
jgi:phage baseplate assembly protein gpV